MTNGSHLLMHSRIWTIAVSHYMKNAGKSTQIQRLRHEENPCRNVVPAQRNTRNCRSFRHKLHPSVFQAFRAGKEGKNDVRTRTRLQPERLTDTRAYEKKPSMLFAVVIFLSVVVLGVIAALRFTKGIIPLRTYESRELPGFPGPAGLIHRLDGAEKRQRKLEKARFPGVDENGFISLPPAWEGKVTAGRLACVAHTWAMSSLVREDPEAAKARKTASARATMIPFFTALILLGMLAAGLLKFQIALAIGLACWAFFTFSALPSQFREWKAAEIAKSGLKEAGLWPVLPSDAMAVEQCLKALSWCHVAGFRRILPR